MTREQMIATLEGRAGTAAELAQRCDCDPRDSTFRKALKALVDDRKLFKTGDVIHPRVIASGFGAAVELGIQGGPLRRVDGRPVTSELGQRRTEAFSRFRPRSKYAIGSGKV